MTEQYPEILVSDNGITLEHRVCRRMLLPDGRDGAVWRGLVYPLLPENRIDIAGEAVAPSACRPVMQDSPLSGAVLIDGNDEALLLIAGPAAFVARWSSDLQDAGASVLRSGRYLGDPMDGFAADWFIRFAKPTDMAPVRALLARPGVVEIPPAPSSDALRVRLLLAELAQARAKAAALALDAQGLREAAAAGSAAAAESEALRQAIEHERLLRAEAEAARADLETALANAPSAAVPGRIGRPVEEMAAVFEAFLPRLRPLRDSLAVAAGAYAGRRLLYRALAELQASVGRMPGAWKAVQGVPGWWERHVSNGQDATGRLYARFIPDEQVWEVLVSGKADQPRDMAWIRHKAG